MPHTLTIPDELWDAAGGSPMELRNQLYVTFMKHELRAAEAAGKARQEGKPVEAAPASNGGSAREPYGTMFISHRETVCPFCSRTIYPDMMVVQTSWTKQVSDGVEIGAADAVHLGCAEQNDIRVDWTPERILGDLRRRIAKIPKRRLGRRRRAA